MNALFKYLPVVSLVTVIVAITILSLLPPETGLEIKKDKLGHFIAYFVLSANALFFAKNGRAILFIFLAVFGYGGFLEFLQGFVPGRQPSTWDMLANSTGALIGVAFHLTIGKRLKKGRNI